MKRLMSQGFGAIELVLILAIGGLIGGAGYYVYNSQKQTNSTLEKSTNSQVDQQKNKNQDLSNAAIVNAGWKRYDSNAQKISFEYPGDWFVSEDSDSNRIYISNTKGEVTKANTPSGFQNLWISTSDIEVSQAKETKLKNAESDTRMISGSVTSSIVKNGDFSINSYEYTTVGGMTIEAFWANSSGKRYYATTSTEVGEAEQQSMVTNLKTLLPTILLLN